MLAPPGETICFLQIEASCHLYYFSCLKSEIITLHSHNSIIYKEIHFFKPWFWNTSTKNRSVCLWQNSERRNSWIQKAVFSTYPLFCFNWFMVLFNFSERNLVRKVDGIGIFHGLKWHSKTIGFSLQNSPHKTSRLSDKIYVRFISYSKCSNWRRSFDSICQSRIAKSK